MELTLSLSLTAATSINDQAPAGYGFLRIGNPSSSQRVRIGGNASAPRLAIKTGA